jgi:hypothetical protein
VTVFHISYIYGEKNINDVVVALIRLAKWYLYQLGYGIYRELCILFFDTSVYCAMVAAVNPLRQ